MTQTTLHDPSTSLDPFYAPNFSAAAYLNATLPSWSSSTTKSIPIPNTTSLADLSTQTLALLAQLTAQLARLSATLTQLTDEILRSGSRLAYEVEVLHGDTAGLKDVLTDGLRLDIARFVPPQADTNGADDAAHATADDVTGPQKPGYITKLQTLTLVRTRLEAVIGIFGEAAEWILPPSELSQSVLMSVTAPMSAAEIEEREAKGRDFVEKVRLEVEELAEEAGLQGVEADGTDAALRRIEGLRELALVWKGTVEERARMKFVESLEMIVDERRRVAGR